MITSVFIYLVLAAALGLLGNYAMYYGEVPNRKAWIAFLLVLTLLSVANILWQWKDVISHE